MTATQKVIKYCALALAIMLIVGIFVGIVQTVALLASINGELVLEEAKEYSITGEIRELELELSAATLKILPGEAFALSSNLKDLTVKENGRHLLIREKRRLWSNASPKGEVTLTVPREWQFTEVEIQTGAGLLVMEALKTEELSLNLGAGSAELSALTVTREADIEGGAGAVRFEGCSLHNLDFEIGVGEVHYEGNVTGNTKFECGIGEFKLDLSGKREDYTLRLEKGMGSIRLDGETIGNAQTLGEGTHRLTIQGGIGDIDIKFAG